MKKETTGRTPSSLQKSRRKQIILLIIIFFLYYPILSIMAYAEPEAQYKMHTIVLDPGHGGYDTGAKGSGGLFEKDVSLALCQLIAEILQDRYKVILTRLNDVNLDIYQRTSVANHQKADLFISIHTNGSFYHQEKGIVVSYYAEPPCYDIIFNANSKSYANEPQIPWKHYQKTHIPESKLFAESIANCLQPAMPVPDTHIKIKTAPLSVLEGADMPSIFIEIGFLTNPVEEQSLGDLTSLKNYAQLIGVGIDNYLKKNN
ncbi:MAG: N-acetylmuramoyl-L-alanine amidase [Proteobacteria bacterium]|nr:N-acetylmuramoyl-L-alanine amidase [Pseudomonadota bacterium]